VNDAVIVMKTDFDQVANIVTFNAMSGMALMNSKDAIKISGFS
jgi:hypothetical protein